MGDQATILFDALVVGSGASGGWAAKRLSEAGLKVALVDAGARSPIRILPNISPLSN